MDSLLAGLLIGTGVGVDGNGVGVMMPGVGVKDGRGVSVTSGIKVCMGVVSGISEGSAVLYGSEPSISIAPSVGTASGMGVGSSVASALLSLPTDIPQAVNITTIMSAAMVDSMVGVLNLLTCFTLSFTCFLLSNMATM